MPRPKRPRPLIPSKSRKTIPISIVVDDIEVTGDIVFLNLTDLAVVILSPVSRFGTCAHVPWFMAGYAPNQLANESGITERGTRRANDLLKELFQYVEGRPSGWGICKIEADGTWTDI